MTKETYLKSVDILLDAYNNETLFHGVCNKCAVGNLLNTDQWMNDFFTDRDEGIQREHTFPHSSLEHLYQEKGYKREELMKIEHVFETAIHNTWKGYDYYIYKEPKKGQYIGLCAVLEVMATMVEDEEMVCTKEIEKLTEIATTKFHVVC